MVRLSCSDSTVERAFEIALEDVALNIVPLRQGLLEQEALVFRAGAAYEKPWTRDAAINVWSGGGLLCPEVGRNTLLATLERTNGRLEIGADYDQYWDRLIWALGAWWLYLFTGDREFLTLALDASKNTLASLEETEFDPALHLFRGPAVYGDGVAAYPDVYARTVGGHSGILRWPPANPEAASRPGRGLPMHALSTNCLYAAVYEVLGAIAEAVGVRPDPAWKGKAERMRESVSRHFWMPERGHYRYLVDPFGGSDVQEGLGHSFALLFGVADEERRESVFRTQWRTQKGIPCLWPCFDRYRRDGHYGRHSGTVWPPIQGFWAEAAARHGRGDLFEFELRTLAQRAVRDGQFFELYHPETGLPYGGLQEWEGRGIVDDWESYPHQTWSATAFLRMILMGIAGMRFEPSGVRFQPLLPPSVERVELAEFPYRAATVQVTLRGPGARIERVRIDGDDAPAPFLPADASGAHAIEIVLGRD
jgi:mannosylglycerate hydrolase MGH1-like protein